MNIKQFSCKSMLPLILIIAILIAPINKTDAYSKTYDFTVPVDASYVPDELLVRFEPKSKGQQRNSTEKNQILSSLGGGSIKRNFKIVPGLTLVKLPAGKTVKDALKTFNKTDGIIYAHPNYIGYAFSTVPNDPNFVNNALWGLNNIGQNSGMPDADIDAPEAWDIIHDVCDIIVAVIDSGVDYTHPDLAANMWTDGNGHHGYDFVNDDDDPNDDMGHGTWVAGIIGAVGNNNRGVTGVCWNVKIMAIKAITSYGELSNADAVAAIDYAIEKGAKVINASWGVPDNQSLKDTIDAADAAGVLFIAAAGNYQYGTPWYDNDVDPVYPANFDCSNIISVMATNNTDNRASYSHYGATSVDIAAPGGEGDNNPTAILSTIPTSMGSYASHHGTSASAPYVAGACALVWAAHPNLTHLQVKDVIMQSVDPLASLNGLCVTGGRLNLFN
ncbi:MAG: S8 family peptidase, partial [Phycisphaerae bacterium]